MAKSKVPVPSIQQLSRYSKPESLLPVYFFFGEDAYSIDSAVKYLEKIIEPKLSTELDKEVIAGKERTIVELLDMASSFPFGEGKKLLIVRDFDEVRGDKKKFASYANNPNDTTIIILTRQGGISNLEAEPYTTLLKHNYLFEAKEPKGEELINWVVRYASLRHKTISQENASLLTEIAGENRSLIEMQLQKIISFLGSESKEITGELINNISSNLKELTIFDLQNAVSRRDTARAYECTMNLLEQGKDILFIISMLTRFFSLVSQIPELEKLYQNNDREVSQKLGIYYRYYESYKTASRYYRDKRLFKAARALFEADLAVKTSAGSSESLAVIMLTEIMS